MGCELEERARLDGQCWSEKDVLARDDRLDFLLDVLDLLDEALHSLIHVFV